MNYVSKENLSNIVKQMAQYVGSDTGAGLEDWQASHEYKENDIFVYSGQIYKSIVDFESDTTFSVIQILEEYELQGGETPIAYVKGTDIAVDDIVSYDSNYYKALYDFTCGEEFSLYAFEQYTPKELTTVQEQQIVQHWQEYLGTGSGSSESSPTHYSTTEKMVGTWIDGKPLYQKTVQITLPSTVEADIDVYTLDANVSIKKIEAVIYDNHDILMSPWNYTSSYYFMLFGWDNYIRCRQKGYSSKTGYATVQYTKTTD